MNLVLLCSLRLMAMLWLAASALVGVRSAEIDYAPPKLLPGTIYEMSSGTNKVLFTYKRTSMTSNSTVRVLCDSFYPSGALAARETIVYERGKLASIELEEKQTGAHGTAAVAIDPKKPAKPRLVFDWVTGPGAKKKTDSEALQPDTLVGDMIPYFIVEHWNELTRGQAVPFRFIAQDRLETVGFKLVKEGDVTWRGKSALRLRMEASSFIIAKLVDPLFFIVEKDGTHRVLEYDGRTTPKKRDGEKWKDLDARTIYHWE
jgi:hypothetical protein